MRNFHIGTITGIPIRVNITLLVFLPVLAWLISRPAQIAIYAGVIEGLSPHAIDVDVLQAGATPWIVGIATAVGLFAGVLIHELGHSWTARRYGISITSITLWIFGGMAHMADLPEDWDVEFWIAIAGPITSVLLGLACYGLLQVVPADPVLVFVVGWLAVVNVTLAVFNMLPAFPMDGGRILRALLARSRPYAEATQTAAAVGKGMAVLMAIIAIVAFAPLLLLIAMFVYVAASSESKATVLRDLFRDMTASDLMSTDVRTVTPETSMTALLDRVLAERHTAYPVVEDGRAVGIVTLEDIRRVDEADRAATSVRSVMRDPPPAVAPDTDAFALLRTISGERGGRLLVVDGEALVGIVTNTDIAQAVEVLQGLGPRREIPTPDGYA